MALDNHNFKQSPVYAALTIFRKRQYKSCSVTKECLILSDGTNCMKIDLTYPPEVALREGLCWRTLSIKASSGEAMLLRGLPKKAAHAAAERILESSARVRAETAWPGILILREGYDRLTSCNSYVAKSELDSFLELRSKTDILRKDDLPHLNRVDPEKAALLGDLHQSADALAVLIQHLNEMFVERELALHKEFFDSVEKNPLTPEQRTAIVRNEDNNLVIAGAGSGKTSTIVGRAAYLLKAKGVPPEQVLMLAFTRKASEEMRDRVRQRTGVDLAIRTFHSLGLDILSAVDGRKPSLAQEAEEDIAMAGTLQDIFERRMAGDEIFRSKFTGTYLYFKQAYKAEYDFKSQDEYAKYLAGLDLQTLYSQRKKAELETFKGEHVRSLEELEIANALFVNGINYQYEPDYAIDTADTEHRQYRPDFFLPGHGIYIEHFGVDRNDRTASFIDGDKYRASMRWKRELHKKQGTALIETYSWMKKEGNLAKTLIEILVKIHGVRIKPMSRDEVTDCLMTANCHTHLTSLCKTFISLFKGGPHSFADLEKKAAAAEDPTRLQNLLYLVRCLYEGYEQKLREEGRIDFSDMIAKAADHTEAEAFTSPFTHILIDEFQDIAYGRARLVKALRNQVRGCRVFAVGDDWQSIYRFTGSDIGIMRRFRENFGATAVSKLQDTFRFNDKIAGFSTRFILKNPSQLQKEIRTRASAEGPCVLVRFQPPKPKAGAEASPCDVLGEILGEISAEVGPDKTATVFLLERYNFKKPEKDDVAALRRKYRNLTLESHTIHVSKGLEADYVVIGGCEGGKFGFPSQVEDDPLIGLLLTSAEDYPYAEERRLFYVGVTRARRKAYLVAGSWRPSAFIMDILGEAAEYGVHVHYQNGYETAICPLCKTGILTPRDGSNGLFWACTNYPACNYTEDVCPECRRGWMKKDGKDNLKCVVCGHTTRKCPSCGIGRLVHRSGKYGPFVGCTMFSKELNCKYTERLR